MQERSNKTDSPRTQNSLELPRGVLHVRDKTKTTPTSETADAKEKELVVMLDTARPFDKNDGRDSAPSQVTADASKTGNSEDAPVTLKATTAHAPADAPETKVWRQPEANAAPNTSPEPGTAEVTADARDVIEAEIAAPDSTPLPLAARDYSETRHEAETQRWLDTREATSAASDSPMVSESLTKPLLAIVAVASLAAAAWSYSSLEDARAQLTTLSASKAAIERTLTDAQGRLAAAEKAVADVKAALSPATAKKAPVATEPAAKAAP